MTDYLPIENISTISIISEPESYKIDIIWIFWEDLQYVKLNSLCPHNTWQTLEGGILGYDPNNLKFPFYSGNTKLSDITFTVEGDIYNRNFRLQNHWKSEGKHLAFKVEEGLESMTLIANPNLLIADADNLIKNLKSDEIGIKNKFTWGDIPQYVRYNLFLTLYDIINKMHKDKNKLTNLDVTYFV
jgi:hypothetical protein